MQTRAQRTAQKKEGYILLVTLGFALILLIVLATTMRWVISNSTVTQRNSQFVASEYAAEGATERVLGQIAYDWMNGTQATNPATYALLIPTNTSDWPVQYVFSDTNGNNNRVSVVFGQQQTNWVALPSPYTGLKAYLTPITLAAVATPTGQRFNVPATVSQNFNLSDIPIFQYLIFYNVNLEIDAGAALELNGPVFSNAGMWTGSTVVTFDQIAWCVSKTLVNGANDPWITYTGTGASVYKMKGEPVSGVNHVTMPIAGTNNNAALVEGILQWPPPAYGLGTYAAYFPPNGNGQYYLANEADLIISNSANGVAAAYPPVGTNFYVYYQDPYMTGSQTNSNPNNFCPAIQWVTNDYYLITNAGLSSSGAAGHQFESWSTNYVPASRWTNSAGLRFQVWYAGYSFLTNALFYDWREGWTSASAKKVQAVQFDVSKFNTWLGNNTTNGGGNYNTICRLNKNHSIGRVYVYNSVSLAVLQLPAVRVVNGSQLYDSYGFSIGTPMPLYVEGNFNVTDGSGSSDAGTSSTAHSRPASFLADAITILSSGFSDTSTTKDPPVSGTTTIHAACLEGIVPSDPNLGTPGDNSQYSGGVENFLRLLESWGNLYYNGSIVVMFPSQYATNRWRATGNYYDAPTRHWTFDTNFTVSTKLPPFTPQLKTTIRNTWTGY